MIPDVFWREYLFKRLHAPSSFGLICGQSPGLIRGRNASTLPPRVTHDFRGVSNDFFKKDE